MASILFRQPLRFGLCAVVWPCLSCLGRILFLGNEHSHSPRSHRTSHSIALDSFLWLWPLSFLPPWLKQLANSSLSTDSGDLGGPALACMCFRLTTHPNLLCLECHKKPKMPRNSLSFPSGSFSPLNNRQFCHK